jgi:hypothetical protein
MRVTVTFEEFSPTHGFFYYRPMQLMPYLDTGFPPEFEQEANELRVTFG